MRIERFVNGRARSNAYVIARDTDTDCLIIDPGTGAAPRIARRVEELNLTPRAVLLTHGHPDHVWTARRASERYAVPALLHRGDWRWLDDPISGGALPVRPFGRLVSGLTRLRPQRLQELETSSVFGELQVRVLHTPGHTPGSCCLLLDDICFSGDTVFAGTIGRWTFPGGNRDDLLRSVRHVLATLPDDLRLYPGHGPDTTMRREREMLERIASGSVR